MDQPARPYGPPAPQSKERRDGAKAAAWSLLAAAALAAHVLLAAPIAGPQLYGLLAVVGFGLLLPAIAMLHLRSAALVPQGATLATIAGTATSVSGMAALLLNDLEPGALFFLAMWWWVLGKLALETGLLPRPFGTATAAAAALVFAAMFADLFGLGPWAWTAPRLGLALWLAMLALILYRDASRRADAG